MKETPNSPLPKLDLPSSETPKILPELAKPVTAPPLPRTPFPIPAAVKPAFSGSAKFVQPQPPRGFDRGTAFRASRDHARGRHAG